MPALPERPCLRQLRNQAKDLLRALRADAPDARRRVAVYSAGSRASPPKQLRLTDVQRVIAGEYGFDSWAGLKLHVETLPQDDDRARPANSVGSDEEAAEAVNTQASPLAEGISAFPPAAGWAWSVAPAACEGRVSHMFATPGAVVHVTPVAGVATRGNPGAMPSLRVYIALGGATEDVPPELRPVFYDQDGARHALRSGGGRSGPSPNGWSAHRGFDLRHEMLALADVALMGIEAKLSTDDEPRQ